MTSKPTTVSAADIIVPGTARTEVSDTTAMFQRLRELERTRRRYGKHHTATILIGACIAEGMDTRPRIVGAMQRLGFNRSHVVITLDESTGSDLNFHLWQCDAEGRYTLHGQQWAVISADPNAAPPLP